MDIYELIHTDHEEAKSLIEQVMSTSSHAGRLSLSAKLRELVMLYNDAEADSFYVALDAHTSTRSIAARMRNEHKETDALFDAMMNVSMTPAAWEEKFADLRQALILHIGEEEGEVFMVARKVITPAVAQELAVAMQQLKALRRRQLRQAS
jgi:hemerythrin superfamily protein